MTLAYGACVCVTLASGECEGEGEGGEREGESEGGEREGEGGV